MLFKSGDARDRKVVVVNNTPSHMIDARGLSKKFLVYRHAHHRLLQRFIFGGRKLYREFWALRDVDFRVRRGETVGIVGRNGSGKSTLLQLICGVLTATHGTVNVNGKIAPLLELGSGFNPQYTGIENVFLNGTILGMSTREIKRKLDTILAFADIGEFIDRPVKTYSSGMEARLAFSVAIHTDPQILIVDEILAVGDADFQRKCMNRFHELRQSGCTILLVSHDSFQVKSICQRALYLSKGRGVMFGDAAPVVDRYIEDMQSQQSARNGEDANPDENNGQFFRITRVALEDDTGREVTEIQCGETIRLRFGYEALSPKIPEKISFVFNLYRQDDFYVCGATTVMEKIPPLRSKRAGEVSIRFPDFALTAGTYLWRVAINDEHGMAVLAQARYVCRFRVLDQFRSVGLIDLKREWIFDNGTA
jgi:ABC-type polysaccharide/polyol phosphate transport system ATPase subunit